MLGRIIYYKNCNWELVSYVKDGVLLKNLEDGEILKVEKRKFNSISKFDSKIKKELEKNYIKEQSDLIKYPD